jgi:hypothetical protein
LKPTLKDIGINDSLAHRARLAAAMPDDEFAVYLRSRRDLILDGSSHRYPESKVGRQEVTVETYADESDVLVPVSQYMCRAEVAAFKLEQEFRKFVSRWGATEAVFSHLRELIDRFEKEANND